MTEIERKFLVNSEKFPRTESNVVMKQGYLSVDPERVVRVRIEGDQAWITIKGRMKGISRPEFEYQVPVGDAENLLLLALNPPVEKIRHRIETEGTCWEVDEFLGTNRGLIIAEVELESESQEFYHPDWLGAEVTADRRYYNSWLSVHPFSTWQD
jgi:adenylate cyclase